MYKYESGILKWDGETTYKDVPQYFTLLDIVNTPDGDFMAACQPVYIRIFQTDILVYPS